MRALLAVAALGMVAACTTPTPYQPRDAGTGYGYAEQAIETNRVRISFAGNSLTPRETVESYLLFRAAEATIERGYDHFIIADRDTEERSRLQGYGGSPRSRFYFDYMYFSPRFGWRPWYDPFWDEPTSYREITRYEAVAEIAMYRGAKPADNPNAFDARDVQSNLRNTVVTPPVN